MKLPEQHLALFETVNELIAGAKQRIASTANHELTLLYWKIGKSIRDVVLQNERATYGKEVVANLSRRLTDQYGRGWSEQQLRHCLHSAEVFSEEQILSTVWRELSWSHMKVIMYLDDSLKRKFYTEMCRLERWSVRLLSERIDSMLYERTAISRKPDELIEQELEELNQKDTITPDLIFRDPYLLDFLGLKDTFSEKDLETAILADLQRFITEHIELLMLEGSSIKVAQYLTELPEKALLQSRLHQAIAIAKQRHENNSPDAS